MKQATGQENLVVNIEKQEFKEKDIRFAMEKEAKSKGPFIAYVKNSEKEIITFEATTWWRLIFKIGVYMEKQYSHWFKNGIIFKVVRGSAESD